MIPYRTDPEGRTYSSWTDVSNAISEFAAGFISSTVYVETLQDWADSYTGRATARLNILACGTTLQFPAEDYQRWAQEELDRLARARSSDE